MRLAPNLAQVDDFLQRMIFASNTTGLCHRCGLPVAD
jgi:hypothetical protein